jgi:predicted chitinase
MSLTVQSLMQIGGAGASQSICQGVVDDLAWLDKFGISVPHRLAHFLAQCGEESDHFHTLTEYASGSAYEGRRDLGNTQPGDGARFKGRGLIEETGRFNARAFTAWIRKIVPDAPDFEADPTKLATFPWATYSSVWYWTSHDLNSLADANNIIAITHKVNGGLNGLGQRIAMFARAGLVELGYSTLALSKFQADAGLTVDGLTGTETLDAIFAKLKAMEAAPSTAATIPPPAEAVAPVAPAIVRPEVPAAVAEPAAPAPAVATPQATPAHKAGGAAAAAIVGGGGIAVASGYPWPLIVGGAIAALVVVIVLVSVFHKKG